MATSAREDDDGRPEVRRSDCFQLNRDVVAIEYRPEAAPAPEAGDIIRVPETGGPGEFRIVLAPADA